MKMKPIKRGMTMILPHFWHAAYAFRLLQRENLPKPNLTQAT